MSLKAPQKYAEVQARVAYDLAEQLLEWQRARVSVPAMARLLRNQTRVEMADETVRRWVDYLAGAA